MSSFGPSSILCCHCDVVFSYADEGNLSRRPHLDGGEGVLGITCSSCHQVVWHCTLCARSWTAMRNNNRHVTTNKRHLEIRLEYEQRAASALSQADATEQDWDFAEGSGVEFMDDSPSPAPVSPEGGDDWLTSIPEPLGPPATTLDAIRDGGSFPPGSKSPEFYFHEAQQPGEGAKYLTALAFKVESNRGRKGRGRVSSENDQVPDWFDKD